MLEYRLLRAEETDAAADLHRVASVLIPGHVSTDRVLDELEARYRQAFQIARAPNEFATTSQSPRLQDVR